jgi:hypothetical protein
MCFTVTGFKLTVELLAGKTETGLLIWKFQWVAKEKLI